MWLDWCLMEFADPPASLDKARLGECCFLSCCRGSKNFKIFNYLSNSTLL